MSLNEFDLSNILEQITIDKEKQVDDDEEEYEEGDEGEEEEEEEGVGKEGMDEIQKLFSGLMGSTGGEAGDGIQKMLETLFSGVPEAKKEQFEFVFANETVASFYGNEENQKTGENAGIDLFIPDDILISAKGSQLIDLQVTAVLRSVDGTNTSAFWLIPRSSISKTPLRLANSIGLIDAGYRNTLKVAVDNISNADYVISKGTRLFQISAPSLAPLKWAKKEEIKDTVEPERGLGGFGSTGI